MKFQQAKATTHALVTASVKAKGAEHPDAVKALCGFLANAVTDPDYDAASWDEQGTAAVYEAYSRYLRWQEEQLSKRDDALGNLLRAERNTNSSSRLPSSPADSIPTN